MRIVPKPEWGEPVSGATTFAGAFANLHHTLALFEDEANSRRVIQATGNIYGENVWTGLTMGDLRLIARELGMTL